ncbi:head-tail connector protein [Novosphingobium sp. TCA1]|uniref:head-tail connector protein n=1 Tax=Novosphingobium sp. TCA1 TaxID=2682474 RepID=UPI001357A873|nr:head-tail connector protein [Novosphingobium sp. TCA1]
MAVDLALAKQQCRVLHSREDVLITTHLAAARAWVEQYTGKKLTRGEVAQEIDGFCGSIFLAWGPDCADPVITYTDDDGANQQITDARVVGDRLLPPPSGWPYVGAPRALRLSYTAGFAETPADLDAAVLLLVADFYNNREAGAATGATSAAVEALCDQHRLVQV